MPSKRIGELLKAARVLSDEQLMRALDEQRSTGERLGTVLTRMGYIGSDDLARVLSEQFEVESIDLERETPGPEALALVPEVIAFELAALPISLDDDGLVVAMADPSNEESLRRLRHVTGRTIKPRIGPQTALYRALRRSYAESVPSEDLEVIRERLRRIGRYLREIEELLPAARPG